jgi:hypothetical protein
MENSSTGRLFAVLATPTKTFASIAERPTWVAALILLVLIGVVGGWLIGGRLDFEEMIRASLEEQGRQLGEEQIQGVIDMQEKILPTLMIVGPLLGTPVVYLLLGLVFMVVFKMLGGELRFVQSFSVTLHSMMPRAVAGLLSLPVVLTREELTYDELRDGSVLASNATVLAPEDSGPLMISLLSNLDVFTIWTLALLVLGYAVVAKVSKRSAATGVLVLWAVYVLGKLGLAALRT